MIAERYKLRQKRGKSRGKSLLIALRYINAYIKSIASSGKSEAKSRQKLRQKPSLELRCLATNEAKAEAKAEAKVFRSLCGTLMHTLSRSLQVAILQCSCRNVEVAEVRLEQRKVRQVTHPVMVAVTLGQRQPLQRLALLNFSIQVSASLVRHLRQRSDHGFGLSRT